MWRKAGVLHCAGDRSHVKPPRAGMERSVGALGEMVLLPEVGRQAATQPLVNAQTEGGEGSRTHCVPLSFPQLLLTYRGFRIDKLCTVDSLARQGHAAKIKNNLGRSEKLIVNMSQIHECPIKETHLSKILAPFLQ